jgi:hypothetical protein
MPTSSACRCVRWIACYSELRRIYLLRGSLNKPPWHRTQTFHRQLIAVHQCESVGC